MSELLNNVRSRIESLGIGFQFVKTVKTGTNGAEREKCHFGMGYR